MEAQQALAQAQETAAAIVPNAEAVKAQAEQAAKPPTTLPFGIATPEQIAAAINPEAAAAEADPLAAVDAKMDAARAQQQVAQDKLPPAKLKNETDEQKVIRYDAELALGVDSDGKKLTPIEIKRKTDALKKAEERLGAENVTLIRANAAQPSGIVPGGDQSGAIGAPSELDQSAGESGAPIDTRLDDSGRDVKQPDVTATDQQPALNTVEGLTARQEALRNQIDVVLEQAKSLQDGVGRIPPANTKERKQYDALINQFNTLSGEKLGVDEQLQKANTVRQLALEEQKQAGWDSNWPFVPADLSNADFRQLIINDPNLTVEEKNQIFEAGKKLGVVPASETVIKKGEPSVTQAPKTIETKKEGPKKEPTPAVEEKPAPKVSETLSPMPLP